MTHRRGLVHCPARDSPRAVTMTLAPHQPASSRGISITDFFICLRRWVSQTLLLPRSSTWVVTNPLRCNWRVARFASLTDMFLVIYLAGSCANSPLFVAFVGNACSNYLYLSWLEDSILLLEISLPMGDVCSRGRWVGVNLPRTMSFSLLSIHSSSVPR